MRYMLLLALALVPASASAQNANVADLGYGVADRGVGWNSRDATRASFRRAGAWGRCVVAADRDGVREFLDARGVAYRRAEWEMKPVFYDCAREVGAPTLFTQDRIRTAALIDALRSAGRS